MALPELLKKAHESGDFSEVIAAIPYARLIGLECQRFGNDVIFKLPRNPDNIGNPILPAIHGGVIGGFMELAAGLHLMMFMDTPGFQKSWISPSTICALPVIKIPLSNVRSSVRAAVWQT